MPIATIDPDEERPDPAPDADTIPFGKLRASSAGVLCYISADGVIVCWQEDAALTAEMVKLLEREA